MIWEQKILSMRNNRIDENDIQILIGYATWLYTLLL